MHLFIYSWFWPLQSSTSSCTCASAVCVYTVWTSDCGSLVFCCKITRRAPSRRGIFFLPPTETCWHLDASVYIYPQCCNPTSRTCAFAIVCARLLACARTLERVCCVEVCLSAAGDLLSFSLNAEPFLIPSKWENTMVLSLWAPLSSMHDIPLTFQPPRVLLYKVRRLFGSCFHCICCLRLTL